MEVSYFGCSKLGSGIVQVGLSFGFVQVDQSIIQVDLSIVQVDLSIVQVDHGFGSLGASFAFITEDIHTSISRVDCSSVEKVGLSQWKFQVVKKNYHNLDNFKHEDHNQSSHQDPSRLNFER